MILEFPSLSGLRSQTHFSDFAIKFFSQFSSIWSSLKIDSPVLRMISRRPMRLNFWIQQYSLSICWPVPSFVAAAVLLHIWNLPNEITRKQSCCSDRCCSRSRIHSRPVATVLVQIWHILNFRQDSSWFSSPPVSQVSGLTSEISPASFFFSVLINLTISEVWLPSSTHDFSPTREAQYLDTAVVYE